MLDFTELQKIKEMSLASQLIWQGIPEYYGVFAIYYVRRQLFGDSQMKRLLAAILAVPLAACFGPSSEEKKMAEKECPKFIKNEMTGVYETKVFDVYSKKGKVVVEVGYKDGHSRGDSYSVRLCVLDSEKGTISSPSPLNDSEWKK